MIYIYRTDFYKFFSNLVFAFLRSNSKMNHSWSKARDHIEVTGIKQRINKKTSHRSINKHNLNCLLSIILSDILPRQYKYQINQTFQIFYPDIYIYNLIIH